MDDTEKHFLLDPLSARELEILRWIEVGFTNREIAQKLVLSLETIKWYNKQIYSKLGAHNRTQAVASAKAAGLLGAPSDTHDAQHLGQGIIFLHRSPHLSGANERYSKSKNF